METIHTQCPACHKRYLVDPRAIASSQPQFECIQCHSRFFFDLDSVKMSQVAAKLPAIHHHKICPKCSTSNPSKVQECVSCGVIFSRYRDWKVEGEYWQFFNRELSQGWREVLKDYESIEKHQNFLDRCWKAGKLELAARYYGKILEADATDEIASVMKEKIAQIAQVPFDNKPPHKNVRTNRPGFFALVIGLGALFIVTGFLLPYARNLVGTGVALMVLATGASLYLREI